MSNNGNEKSNKAELVNKLEKLIEKIKACREKDGGNYLEECRYVFEMHIEAREAGDPDADLPMLRERLNIGKSTARKMRKMHEFWNVGRPDDAKEFYPKLFSKIGPTKLELVCCLKMEKDRNRTKSNNGYQKKKYLRFHDLVIEGDLATVKLVDPEGSVVVHEKSERELKELFSKPKNDSGGTNTQAVHPKFKTYPALKKAYEDLEAKVVEQEKLIMELLAGKAQSERVVENPSTPSAEAQEQTESKIDDTPKLNSGSNEEVPHLDAVPPKGEEEPSTIENVEEPSEQDQDDFEIEDDADDAPEVEASTPAQRSALRSPQPRTDGRYISLAATPEIPSRGRN